MELFWFKGLIRNGKAHSRYKLLAAEVLNEECPEFGGVREGANRVEVPEEGDPGGFWEGQGKAVTRRKGFGRHNDGSPRGGLPQDPVEPGTDGGIVAVEHRDPVVGTHEEAPEEIGVDEGFFFKTVRGS